MKRILLSLSIILSMHVSYSQFTYLAANGVNTTGTYTDLGGNGTVITTTSGSFDDANSTPQNIGFSFTFNGTAFTQFILNTNGAIKLGAVAPPVTLYDALNSTESNLIYPLNLDLEAGTDPEYRLYTSGIAPNRVCTIQFKNVSDYYQLPAVAPQFQDMDFQIKLYESSNNIEFVYGAFVAGGAASAAIGSDVGIKGNTPSSSVNLTKTSGTAWAASVFIDGMYTVNAHNIRNNILPPSGTIYRFVSAALPAVDAEISKVYTLGKVPVGYGSPHTVTALVRNAGANILANLPVILTVSGANSFTNTQTITTLAPGASALVTFSGYSPAAVGNNTVTVNVGSDDNNANNSLAYPQAVTASTFSYADNSAPASSVGYNTGSGLILNKYTVTGSAFVTDVNVYISGAASNTGNTVYAVVTDAAGTIVGQSANYVITVADLGKYKNLPIITPPAVSSVDFYVGLAQTANAVGYFPIGSQTESPARPGAYYVIPALAGGTAPAENATVGRLMIEAVVSASPLPVGLTSFNGRLQNNTALLSWLTGYEVNSDHFEVERSLSGSGVWTKVGTIAAGGTAAANTYGFTDPGLSSGRWLYRLKIINKDGNYTYSPIIILQFSGKQVFVLKQNYPNPVSGVTMIQYELGKDASVTFELIGMDGKAIMAQQKGKQTKGAYNMQVDVQSLSLAPGNYTYQLLIEDAATGEITRMNKQMQVIR